MRRLTLPILIGLLAVPALADDLTGADRFLCSAVTATVCSPEGDCETGAPWNWNIPQFIRIDLEKATISTTEASGQNRMTPFTNTVRSDGVIVLQGFEGGRAFSFLIVEESGRASVAVAREDLTVSVFAACTPTS